MDCCGTDVWTGRLEGEAYETDSTLSMRYPPTMDGSDLQRRLAPRVQAIVCRNGRTLMAKHREGELVYWCLPGGGLEEGEKPEDGVLRELREEAHVDGRIVRQTNRLVDAQGIEHYSYLVDIGDQQPTLGHDPEVPPDDPILVGLEWLSLGEIPERDRAFLWQAGLMSVPGFLEKVQNWRDEISCPG
jgi:8-oxo-dGTP pyrophosphatase MutT (NUDIX family)